eukprot:scaffold34582_cov160-Amphora_coffeaeformis.AAC.2
MPLIYRLNRLAELPFHATSSSRSISIDRHFAVVRKAVGCSLHPVHAYVYEAPKTPLPVLLLLCKGLFDCAS